MRFLVYLFLGLLAITAALALGCEEKGEFTILFTSDVKGWLTPAG